MDKKNDTLINKKSDGLYMTNIFPEKYNYFQKTTKINLPFYEIILNLYSSHANLAEIFKINFYAFLPQNGLDNFNSIPDFINFRFSFWDFDQFYTPIYYLDKPEKFEINHLLTSPHLRIIKYNSEEDKEEDAIIEIKYDPSINNSINYKTFLKYLAFREIFVQIYDFEKKIPYGYFKFPLSKFLRPNKSKISTEQIELKVFDNFTHEKKGYIILDLESKESKCENIFSISLQHNILNFIDTNDINFNKSIQKRKIVSIGGNYNKIKKHKENLEEQNFLKNIDKINLSIIQNEINIKQISGSKYINQEYDENKENKIIQTIKEYNNNLNNLTISLIQGEPHYFNFIINNNSNNEQQYYIKICSDSNKYQINNEKEEKILSFISNAEEWEYITIIKNLKIPHNYHSISEKGYFILKPNQSLPVLFKVLSYKNFTGFEDNFEKYHSIIIYNIKNVPLYNLKIKIEKVFPIIDFEFYFRIQENTNKVIEFANPYQDMNIMKSKQLLKNCVFINGNKNTNYTPNIQLNENTNNFYFVFNPNQDFADNDKNIIPDIKTKTNNAFKSKVNIEQIGNKKLLFLYKDRFCAELLLTYRFIILLYEYINISYNFGTKMKNLLSFTYKGEENVKLKFYSSDNNIVSFDNEFKNGIIAKKDKIYKINYELYLTKIKSDNEIMVNCLDMKNKEIYKSWIIKPQITKINYADKINMTFIKEINNDIKTTFEYRNPLNKICVIHFTCSTKTVMDIPFNQINFNANEKKKIIINIRKILIPQKITSFIFANDDNNLFNQVIQVSINYK